MDKIKHILLVFFISTNLIAGQKTKYNSLFISLYAGDLSILSEKITNYYDSKNDLTFGIGLGIPLSNTLIADASVSYYQKSSKHIGLNEFKGIESAILKQLIFNIGIQFNLIPNRIIGLSFLLGINYAIINEDRKTADGVFVYQIKRAGNLGIYGGAMFELSLGKGPIAIFGDAKYTYSWKPFLEFEDTYREIKYTAGIKFYFSNRWK